MVVARAIAPAKIILFGEHSVNRGQSALAASVGMHVRCAVTPADGFSFKSGNLTGAATRQDLLDLRARVDDWRARQSFDDIRALAQADFFAPAKYILAHACGGELPAGASIIWHSDIPAAGGLGSGGASAVAFATALLAALTGRDRIDIGQVGPLAYLGDVIAHGGVASALDTQTALRGGVIRYTTERWGEAVTVAPGLHLVIGNTRMRGQTAAVNARVREWLAADATRQHYFEAIGALSDAAVPALASGDWRTLGRLMNLDQLVLEKIGVSTPELERLNHAALSAGALGAKLSGSGGGGVMIALSTAATRQAVAEAITRAGGEALMPEVAVPGAQLMAPSP